jgi:hypothetical protein
MHGIAVYATFNIKSQMSRERDQQAAESGDQIWYITSGLNTIILIIHSSKASHSLKASTLPYNVHYASIITHYTSFPGSRSHLRRNSPP